MDTMEFEAELERRLTLLEDPSYSDPARADLPTLDLVLLAVLGSALVAVLLVWGYPW